MPKNVLILFAHPAQGRSEVNLKLVNAAKALEHVTIVDLYNEYPDYFIDVDKEQKRLLEHDVIIFLHPFYWYSTPAILKEWQDLVLEYGFAYGQDGNKLAGKIFFSTVSAGGSEDAYMQDGANNFTLRELLAPLEQTANLCGMNYLPPFVLYNSRQAFEDGRIASHAKEWTEMIEAISKDRIDLKASSKLPLLNSAKIKKSRKSAMEAS